MQTQAFMNHFQPITDKIDKMAKKSLQATFKQMYAVFCNVLPILVEILTNHLYNQSISSFCMYRAPKSLQKNHYG